MAPKEHTVLSKINCQHIAQHHIAVLVATKTNDVVSIFATALPTYTVYHIPISSTMIGRKGNGVAVLVDQSIHDFVTIWHVSEQIQAVWLKCAGQVFNVPGNVALGAVYLNPKTVTLRRALNTSLTKPPLLL